MGGVNFFYYCVDYYYIVILFGGGNGYGGWRYINGFNNYLILLVGLVGVNIGKD